MRRVFRNVRLLVVGCIVIITKTMQDAIGKIFIYYETSSHKKHLIDDCEFMVHSRGMRSNLLKVKVNGILRFV